MRSTVMTLPWGCRQSSSITFCTSSRIIGSLFIACIVLLGLGPESVSACNKEVKQVGICLHVYLERDFPAIEAAVYRNHARMLGRNSARLEDFLFSGPSLEDSCRKMGRVLDCFEKILVQDLCYYYDDFFRFRSLLESLRITFDWFCDLTQLRTRYLVLLRNWECIETLRNSSQCRMPGRLPTNVWQRIIRSEEDTSICRDLRVQRDCLVQGQEIRNRCGPDYASGQEAERVYKNATDLFFSSWCNSASGLRPPIRSTNSLELVVFLAFYWAFHYASVSIFVPPC